MNPLTDSLWFTLCRWSQTQAAAKKADKFELSKICPEYTGFVFHHSSFVL